MNLIKIIFKVLSILSLLAIGLHADEFAGDKPGEIFPVENYQASLMKMFFMLILLIAFLILTVWLLKKFINSRMQLAAQGKSIQILEKRTISPKSILYLLEIDGEKFLISESQVQIQKIERLKDNT